MGYNICIFSAAAIVSIFYYTTDASESHVNINLELTLGTGSQSDHQSSYEGDGQPNDYGSSSGSDSTRRRFFRSDRGTFVKLKKTDARLALIRQQETALNLSRKNQHEWSFPNNDEIDPCIHVWVRLEIQGMPINDTAYPIRPSCTSKKNSFRTARGGAQYKLMIQLIKNPIYSLHYLDLMRCECQYKYDWNVPFQYSQRVFFIHQVQSSQYIILVPIRNRYSKLIKIVDYQDLNMPA